VVGVGLMLVREGRVGGFIKNLEILGVVRHL